MVLLGCSSCASSVMCSSVLTSLYVHPNPDLDLVNRPRLASLARYVEIMLREDGKWNSCSYASRTSLEWKEPNLNLVSMSS